MQIPGGPALYQTVSDATLQGLMARDGLLAASESSVPGLIAIVEELAQGIDSI